MSIAIHHGPPGSYKTFTLVQRHAIDALKKGRVVVTNIRGFNDIELIKNTYTEIEFPVSASIISIDTKTKDGLLLLAQWFHWVPFGSLILIDESQAVYPNRSDFKIESLDKFECLAGFEIEDTYSGEPRPRDMHLAFDMHRHFGWDLFLSTPNIAKVNKIIRQSTEWAYKHRDISGLLPWYKNKWAEVQHDPESSGKSITSRVGVPTKYNADLRIYKCYSSTATGDHKGSEAGRSVFKDPKILATCFVTVASIIAFLYIFFNSTSSIAGMSKNIKTDKNSFSVHPLQNDHKAINHVISSNNVFIPDQTNILATEKRSDSERSAEGAKLILFKSFDFYGVKDTDFLLIPKDCKIRQNTIICPILKQNKSFYSSTYCQSLLCYALFNRLIEHQQNNVVLESNFIS